MSPPSLAQDIATWAETIVGALARDANAVAAQGPDQRQRALTQRPVVEAAYALEREVPRLLTRYYATYERLGRHPATPPLPANADLLEYRDAIDRVGHELLSEVLAYSKFVGPNPSWPYDLVCCLAALEAVVGALRTKMPHDAVFEAQVHAMALQPHLEARIPAMGPSKP